MKSSKYVVGIAGGSASGKTTFAGKLENALAPLQVKVFHMDYYFKGDDERPKSLAPVGGKIYLDDNHPLSMDLPRLAADLRAYLEMGDAQVIIVEGLLTLWDDEICDMLDLKLFVDCQADERIVRRLRRNMNRGLSFDQVADVYLDLVRYRHNEYVEPSRWRADFILNGSHPSETTLEMLVMWINKKIGQK